LPVNAKKWQELAKICVLQTQTAQKIIIFAISKNNARIYREQGKMSVLPILIVS
jgi:hypothetical protein